MDSTIKLYVDDFTSMSDEDLLDFGMTVSEDFGSGEIAELLRAIYKLGHTHGVESERKYMASAAATIADNL